MPPQTFRIRWFSVGGKHKNKVARLAVPSAIARALDPEIDYLCELTEEGILYRPAEPGLELPPKLPPWALRRRELPAGTAEGEPERPASRRD